MQVVKKHFKDLAYVRVDGENSSKLVVYTDSDEDRDLLMVRGRNWKALLYRDKMAHLWSTENRMVIHYVYHAYDSFGAW